MKQRWKEYTELYDSGLNDPDNHDGVISHSELSILECEIKWALGSSAANKTSGTDGIPADLCKILKDDAIKELHSMCQQIWKTHQWPHDWECQSSSQFPRRAVPKIIQTTIQFHSSPMLVRICSKSS